MGSSYALILRLTGQYHLVVGILHLFGFELPRVMHLFGLATSFTDYWRRANVYWKDFILKVCYYPLYFSLRQWSPTSRLVVGTLASFAATWFLHAYQWFWIRGSFLLSLPDVLFWASFAILVLAASLHEANQGRSRTLGRRTPTALERVKNAVRATGVTLVITLLWSLWISPSVSDWWSLMTTEGVTLAGLAGAAALTGVALMAAQALADAFGEADAKPAGVKAPAGAAAAAFWRQALPTALGIALLFSISRPVVQASMGERVADRVRDMQVARMSSRDVDLLTRGYYEDLNNFNSFNSELWEVYSKRPEDDYVTLHQTAAGRRTGDFLVDEIVPLKKIVFKGAVLTTNRWGLRDQDYEQVRPASTYRMAILGGSFVVGTGVADEETFEWQLEKRLNRLNSGGPYSRYEILNFAVPGYSGLQSLMSLERKALAFEPNAVIYTSHPREVTNSLRHLVSCVRAGREIPWEHLRELVAKVGATERMPEGEIYRRLAPFGDEIVAWVYRRVAEIAKERGMAPLSIYFPVLQPNENDPAAAAKLMRMARDAGMQVVDISDVYSGQDVTELRVAEWDWHPNARAHRLIADRILRGLMEQRVPIPLPPSIRTAVQLEDAAVAQPVGSAGAPRPN
jgi:hypothetical protein